jgi:hypothetical protein
MGKVIIVNKRTGAREVADQESADRLKNSIHARLFQFIPVPTPVELVDHDVEDEIVPVRKKNRKSSL